jgi:hypothetical protein
MWHDHTPAGQARAPLSLAPYYTFGVLGWMAPRTGSIYEERLTRDLFVKKFFIKVKLKKYFSFRLKLPSAERSSQQGHEGSTITTQWLGWRKRLRNVKERVPEEEIHAHACLWNEGTRQKLSRARASRYWM